MNAMQIIDPFTLVLRLDVDDTEKAKRDLDNSEYLIIKEFVKENEDSKAFNITKIILENEEEVVIREFDISKAVILKGEYVEGGKALKVKYLIKK